MQAAFVDAPLRQLELSEMITPHNAHCRLSSQDTALYKVFEPRRPGDWPDASKSITHPDTEVSSTSRRSS